MKFKIEMIIVDRFDFEDYAYTKEQVERDLKNDLMNMEMGIEEFLIEEVKE